MALSEAGIVGKYSVGGVPKYSAEWWKRVSNFLGGERMQRNEHLPPSLRWIPQNIGQSKPATDFPENRR